MSIGKLPKLKPKIILCILLREGFYIHHQTGSHMQLHHPIKKNLRVTVPYHTRFDLPSPVLLSILKQADIAKGEFLRMMKRK